MEISGMLKGMKSSKNGKYLCKSKLLFSMQNGNDVGLKRNEFVDIKLITILAKKKGKRLNGI